MSCYVSSGTLNSTLLLTDMNIIIIIFIIKSHNRAVARRWSTHEDT